MSAKIRVSTLNPLMKHALGYIEKDGMSSWDLVALALSRSGLTKLPKTQLGRYNAARRLIRNLGLNKCGNEPATSSDKFLKTLAWRKTRMIAIKKYGARCQCCGATPGDGVRINVDHIKPRKLFHELALDVSNLQVLCEECNHGKGNWDQTDWR